MPEQPNLAWLLGEARESVLERLRVKLAAAGHEAIRAPHQQVFRHLDKEGSRLTDLAERAHMTKQAFGEHVAYLEEHGYLARVPDPDDRRAKRIVTTDQGREVMAIAAEAFAEVEAEWASRIGDDAVRQARAALRALAHDRVPPRR